MVRMLGVVEAVDIEPVTRDLAANISRLLKKFPELGGRVDAAGKPTGTTDDGNRLLGASSETHVELIRSELSNQRTT
jgi:hypothetical protein